MHICDPCLMDAGLEGRSKREQRDSADAGANPHAFAGLIVPAVLARAHYISPSFNKLHIHDGVMRGSCPSIVGSHGGDGPQQRQTDRIRVDFM